MLRCIHIQCRILGFREGLVIRITIFLTMLLLSACQQQTATDTQLHAGEPVGRVGEKIFYTSDVDMEVSALPTPFSASTHDTVLRAHVLHTLIQRYVLSQKALSMNMQQNADVEQQMIRARDDILIEHLKQWKLAQMARPSADEIKAYYTTHGEEFTIPAQVHVRHILLGSEKKARRILRLLSKGRTFSTLAAAYSLDESNKVRSGDLNWFPLGVMVKPFEQAVFNRKKLGVIPYPVKTRYGWHVIELLGKRPATKRTFKETQEDIINALQHQRLSLWIEKLIHQAKPKLFKR